MGQGWACVCRMGGIGDNLMAASTLAPLKKMGYKVEVLTSESQSCVFLNNPHVDKLSIKKDGDLPENNMLEWQKWIQSRANEYEVFAHLSHSCEVRHGLFPSSTEFWLSPEYRRKRCGGSYLETVHDIAGVPYEFGPLFYPTDEEREHAQNTKRQVGPKCIGWVIAGSRIDKIYPYTTIIIPRIIKELGIPVVVTGASNDREWSSANAIREAVTQTNGTRDGFFSVVQKPGTDPQEMHDCRPALTFLQECDLVISPDTGPAWAVAFEDVPKIIMVSHASVENITKHWVNTITLHADPDRVPCWPCHRLHNDASTCVPNKEQNGAACISDISVQTLFEAVAETFRASDQDARRLGAIPAAKAVPPAMALKSNGQGQPGLYSGHGQPGGGHDDGRNGGGRREDRELLQP